MSFKLVESKQRFHAFETFNCQRAVVCGKHNSFSQRANVSKLAEVEKQLTYKSPARKLLNWKNYLERRVKDSRCGDLSLGHNNLHIKFNSIPDKVSMRSVASTQCNRLSSHGHLYLIAKQTGGRILFSFCLTPFIVNFFIFSIWFYSRSCICECYDGCILI